MNKLTNFVGGRYKGKLNLIDEGFILFGLDVWWVREPGHPDRLITLVFDGGNCKDATTLRMIIFWPSQRQTSWLRRRIVCGVIGN